MGPSNERLTNAADPSNEPDEVAAAIAKLRSVDAACGAPYWVAEAIQEVLAYVETLEGIQRLRVKAEAVIRRTAYESMVEARAAGYEAGQRAMKKRAVSVCEDAWLNESDAIQAVFDIPILPEPQEGA